MLEITESFLPALGTSGSKKLSVARQPSLYK